MSLAMNNAVTLFFFFENQTPIQQCCNPNICNQGTMQLSSQNDSHETIRSDLMVIK